MIVSENVAAPARWQPVLGGAIADRAIGVAADVAGRVNDPATLAAALDAAVRQSSFPTTTYWDPSGIAQGHAGLALACGYLDEALGAGADRIAHRHLAAAANAVERPRFHPDGLFSGLGGMTLAAWALSRGGTRYGNLLAQLKTLVLDALARRRGRFARRGMGFGEFDVISGSAGTVAYLLPLRDDPAVGRALDELIEDLAALFGDPGETLPRWYTPRAMLGENVMAAEHPYGNLNCGLAHGLPGVVAALALAHCAGVRTARSEAALRATAEWIVHHAIADPWGIAWPYAIPLTGENGVPAAVAPDAAWRNGPSRSAWCYGSPGVARALWLAGEALGDDELRALAVEAVKAVLRRPRLARGAGTPTLCHGVAGVLAVVLRFANDTRLAVFTEGARELVEELLDAYDPDAPVGFRDLEPGGVRVDRPGLLDGAAGVAITLLAAASSAEPVWDRLFMLS